MACPITIKKLPPVQTEAKEPTTSATDKNILKTLKLTKLTNEDQIQMNRLFLSERDAKVLFPEWSQKEGELSDVRYVKIALTVYKVAVSKFIAVGSLGLNSIQYNEILSSAFTQDLNDTVSISPFHLSKQPVTHLKKVYIDLSIHKSAYHYDSENPISIHLESFRQFMREALKLNILTPERSFMVSLGATQLKATINVLYYPTLPEGMQSEEYKYCQYGIINERTTLDFVTDPASPIKIIEEVIDNSSIKSLDVMVTAVENPDISEDDRDITPPILKKEEIQKRALESFLGQRVVIGQNKRHRDDESGWDFNFEIKRVKTNVPSDQSNNDREKTKYQKSFGVDNDSPISIDWNPAELIVTNGTLYQATDVEFKVLGHTGSTRDYELQKFHKSWLSAEELKDEILDIDTPFARGEKFIVEVSSGEFVVELTKVHGDDSCENDKRKKAKNTWAITDNTTIKFTVSGDSGKTLVENKEAQPIKELVIKLKPARLSPFQTTPSPEIVTKNVVINALNEQLTSKKVYRDQKFTINVGLDSPLKGRFEEISFNESKSQSNYSLLGKITSSTTFRFINNPECTIQVLADKTNITIDDPVKELEERGLGGLSEQMNEIIREFFLFRGKMYNESIRRGLTSEKGILFHGPPGTGKTAFARNLSQMLGAIGQNVTFISGPSIFHKWVGESEKNIRNLFKDAKLAKEKLGAESPLFVIIIDEIDAMLSTRGDENNSVRNSVVNQFLTEIDGPEQLDNILVIGMTNRKDQLDPAAIRSGRLGVHIKIGLPDEKGREKIFEIHAKQLAKQKLVSDDISFNELAKKTDGWTGAEIEAVVKKAARYSVQRLYKLNINEAEMATHPDRIVTMNDIKRAIDKVSEIRGGSKPKPPPHGMYT